MKKLSRKILSLLLVITIVVSMAVMAMPTASAGLVSNLITRNYTAIALGTIERVTCTAVSKVAGAATDETLKEVLDWTSRILSGYQSVVNKTLIQKTQEISQQLDEIYSLSVTEFASINDKLNKIVQEDAGDDFNRVRTIVTDAGDKYQKMILDFDNLFEKFLAYNNDPSDENKAALKSVYDNLCIDYKYELNANNKDKVEENVFILPMTEGGFLKTVSPYSYNNSVYYNDELNITDVSRWGTADNQRETYLDALFDYSSSVYNFENNVYDLMNAGVNEVADAVSMYIQAYRYYVELNTSLIMADTTIDDSTKTLLTSRLSQHFEEYSYKAIRALNQMCEEYKDVFTTYMRSYDTVSTVTLKDYVLSTTVKEAYPGFDVDSDIADIQMHTMWKHDRSRFDVYQFKLVNESSNEIYAIRVSDGSTSSDSKNYPVSFASDSFTNNTGAFSLDLLNSIKGTTNGLRCISGLSDISNIYNNNTNYKDSDNFINNIRRELGVSNSSVVLESVAVTGDTAAPGAYMVLDTDIDWAGGHALFGNSYADMTWLDVSKQKGAMNTVVVDSEEIKNSDIKNTQLNIMYKGTPFVSLDVNEISADGVSGGTGEVYIGGNCVISNNGAASNLTSSSAMTLRLIPEDDSYVSNVVLKNSNGAVLSTIYSGSQEDYSAICDENGVAEFGMPVPCQDTVIEVTYSNVIEEYTVELESNDNVDLYFENSDKTKETFKELQTVTFEALPYERYVIGGVRIIDEYGYEITPTVTDIESETDVKGAKRYSFVMPEANVKVTIGAYLDAGYDIVIHNYEELCEMRDNINSGAYYELERGTVSANQCRYVLANDIVCPEGSEWIPVAAVDDGFAGAFYGRGYSIDNLTITDTTLKKAGLFETLGSNAVVQNLYLDNLSITTGIDCAAGGIVCDNAGVINNCHVSGVISSAEDIAFSEDSINYIGAICFENAGKITNCTADLDFYVGDSFLNVTIGGITSMNTVLGEISNCSYSGTIEAYGIMNVAGGIVGMSAGMIEKCYNTGDIITQGWVNAGGVAGYVYKGILSDAGILKIKDCYNTGDITVREYFSASAESAAFYEQFKSEEGEIFHAGGLFGNAEQTTASGLYSCGNITIKDESIYTPTGTTGENFTVSNYYYLVADGSEITDDSQKYMSEFESGEVAYLLNSGVTNGTQVWYQNLDNGEVADTSPKFEGGTVYESAGNCIGVSEGYTNNPGGITHNYNNYHVCKDCITLREGEAAGIYGFSIGLGGNISVNYFMLLDEDVAADPTAKMVFTVPSGNNAFEVTVPVAEAQTTTVTVPALGETRTLHVFECEVAAKEMASEILCQVVSDTDSSDIFSYTVKEYAEVILANPETFSKEIPLVKAMLNYGAEAQIAFGHNLGNLANTSDYITEEEKVLAGVDFTPYAYTVEDNDENISFYGAAISLKSETAIKLYFSFENPDDVANTVVTVNGKPYELKKNGTLYELKIADIPAHKLGENYHVEVGGVALDYSVFSYCNSVSASGNDNGFGNVGKALYAYNQAALTYKGLL